MAKILITEALYKTVKRKFSTQEANKVIDYLETLEKSPKKGKSLGNVGGFVIKELKYKKFRFFFITDGFVLKFGSEEELASLLIKFVRMSEKKEQQKVINEIKRILTSLGFESF